MIQVVFAVLATVPCTEFVRDSSFSACGEFTVPVVDRVRRAGVAISSGSLNCEGVLVGDGKILTADHCVPQGASARVEFGLATVDVPPSRVQRPFSSVGLDLIVLQLSETELALLSGEGASPVQVRTRERTGTQRLLLARGSLMFMTPTTTLAPNGLWTLRYFVDSYGGDSGAPIYDSAGFLVGIHSYGSYGSDPAGAVWLTPLADGRSAVQGAASIGCLAMADVELHEGAGSVVFGSVVAPACSALLAPPRVEVDLVAVPEAVLLFDPVSAYPAQPLSFSFVVPARFRDGSAHGLVATVADLVLNSVGPPESISSNVLTVLHHLPVGSFAISGSQFSASFTDSDSSFLSGSSLAGVPLPYLMLESCPGVAACQSLVLSPQTVQFASGGFTASYQGQVPSAFWLGGQAIRARVMDNEDQLARFGDATLAQALGPSPWFVVGNSQQFDLGYPTGKLTSVQCKKTALSSVTVTATGDARAVQPGMSAVPVGLVVGGKLLALTGVSAPFTLTASFGIASSVSVSVLAFNPLRPLPAVGAKVAVLSNFTQLYSGAVQCK